MVIRAKDREPDQIIQDYLSAKARTDILGAGFQPTENQLNELRNIINIFGEYSLSRSRNNKGLSKKTLERVIPRFLKNNLTGFVDRLQQMEELPSKNCQEYFILAYGAAEAKIFQDEKAKKCSRSEESVGKEKWEEWIHNRSGSFLDRWTAEHGIEVAVEKCAALKQLLSFPKTLPGYIHRYGEEVGRQKYEERYHNVNSAEYKTYARKVHRLSGKTYAENIDTINPNRYNRTLCGVEGGWQLDHIIPIKECFMNGRSAEEASLVTNLRMLPWRDNLMRNYGNNT